MIRTTILLPKKLVEHARFRRHGSKSWWSIGSSGAVAPAPLV